MGLMGSRMMRRQMAARNQGQGQGQNRGGVGQGQGQGQGQQGQGGPMDALGQCCSPDRCGPVTRMLAIVVLFGGILSIFGFYIYTAVCPLVIMSNPIALYTVFTSLFIAETPFGSLFALLSIAQTAGTIERRKGSIHLLHATVSVVLLTNIVWLILFIPLSFSWDGFSTMCVAGAWPLVFGLMAIETRIAIQNGETERMCCCIPGVPLIYYPWLLVILFTFMLSSLHLDMVVGLCVGYAYFFVDKLQLSAPSAQRYENHEYLECLRSREGFVSVTQAGFQVQGGPGGAPGGGIGRWLSGATGGGRNAFGGGTLGGSRLGGSSSSSSSSATAGGGGRASSDRKSSPFGGEGYRLGSDLTPQSHTSHTPASASSYFGTSSSPSSSSSSSSTSSSSSSTSSTSFAAAAAATSRANTTSSSSSSSSSSTNRRAGGFNPGSVLADRIEKQRQAQKQREVEQEHSPAAVELSALGHHNNLNNNNNNNNNNSVDSSSVTIDMSHAHDEDPVELYNDDELAHGAPGDGRQNAGFSLIGTDSDSDLDDGPLIVNGTDSAL